jgi:hypothetical protein
VRSLNILDVAAIASLILLVICLVMAARAEMDGRAFDCTEVCKPLLYRSEENGICECVDVESDTIDYRSTNQ